MEGWTGEDSSLYLKQFLVLFSSLVSFSSSPLNCLDRGSLWIQLMDLFSLFQNLHQTWGFFGKYNLFVSFWIYFLHFLYTTPKVNLEN